MHRTRLTVITLLLVLPLTACGTTKSPETTTTTVDCTDASLSEKQRNQFCEDPPLPGSASETQGVPHKLGTSATTAGTRFQSGGGHLEVTPTTVVYSAAAGAQKAQNGVFAVVTVRDRPTGRSAGESAPVEGGGWEWVASSGEAIDAGNGPKAGSIRIAGFTAEGIVKAGTSAWSSQVFDLKESQRGGTLVYVDGEGTEHRWTMPTTDIGPQVAELKKKLAG